MERKKSYYAIIIIVVAVVLVILLLRGKLVGTSETESGTAQITEMESAADNESPGQDDSTDTESIATVTVSEDFEVELGENESMGGF